MNILFIAPYLPSKIRARSFNFILELARRNHLVTLIALRSKDDQPSQDLLDACKHVTTVVSNKTMSIVNSGVALATNASLWMASCVSSGVNQAVEDACSKASYDILHLEHVRAATYVENANYGASVFDAVDCMEPLLLRIAEQKRNPIVKAILKAESRKVGIKEAAVAMGFDSVIITSQQEKALLQNKALSADINVVPIGVDLARFVPSTTSRDPYSLVFTGKMNYHPNADAALWFATEVFPTLKKRFSRITLTIAGAEPTPKVRGLGLIPGIIVTGFVPDLQAVIQNTSIAICPLRVAAGAQFKVVEAMACGLPVVASVLAASSVISDCDSILVAREVEEWVEMISGLVEHPDEAIKLGVRNRAYVESRCSWQSSVDSLENVYRGLLDRCADRHLPPR